MAAARDEPSANVDPPPPAEGDAGGPRAGARHVHVERMADRVARRHPSHIENFL